MHRSALFFGWGLFCLWHNVRMKPPDPSWIPFVKHFNGTLVILMSSIMALCFGLGDVRETTSFGNKELIGGLMAYLIFYAQWAYHRQSIKSED